jgi:hypothetical protein
LVQAIELLACILRKVLYSNLERDTGYPDWGFSWFSSALTWKCWDITTIRPRPLPSKSFTVHPIIQSFIFPILTSQESNSLRNRRKTCTLRNGACFESRPGHRLSSLRRFVVFPGTFSNVLG